MSVDYFLFLVKVQGYMWCPHPSRSIVLDMLRQLSKVYDNMPQPEHISRMLASTQADDSDLVADLKAQMAFQNELVQRCQVLESIALARTPSPSFYPAIRSRVDADDFLPPWPQFRTAGARAGLAKAKAQLEDKRAAFLASMARNAKPVPDSPASARPIYGHRASAFPPTPPQTPPPVKPTTPTSSPFQQQQSTPTTPPSAGPAAVNERKRSRDVDDDPDNDPVADFYGTDDDLPSPAKKSRFREQKDVDTQGFRLQYGISVKAYQDRNAAAFSMKVDIGSFTGETSFRAKDLDHDTYMMGPPSPPPSPLDGDGDYIMETAAPLVDEDGDFIMTPAPRLPRLSPVDADGDTNMATPPLPTPVFDLSSSLSCHDLESRFKGLSFTDMYTDSPVGSRRSRTNCLNKKRMGSPKFGRRS